MPPLLPSETSDLAAGSLQKSDAEVEKAAEPVGLTETLRLAVFSPQMRYSVPIILYNGMSLGFFFSDFPGFYSKKHEDIMLPTSDVGYVTATFYLVNSLGKPTRCAAQVLCCSFAALDARSPPSAR
jgi:hypothetical protein